jgi:hypothetical protein
MYMKTKSDPTETALNKPVQIPAPAKSQSGSPPRGSAEPRLSHEEIAMPARILWQNKGCPQGRDEEIWLEAEQTLLSRSARQSTQQFPKTTSKEDSENAHRIEDRLADLLSSGGDRSATSL